MPPIPEAQWTDDQKRSAQRIMSGPRGDLRGPFIPLMRSPELMDRIQAVGEYLRFGMDLSAPLREMAILMTARWANCEYEFQAHRLVGLKAGLQSSKIDAIGAGRRPDDLTSEEALIHDVVSEVLATGTLSDATYARAKDALGERGVVDIVALPGYYFMLALVLNTARSPIVNPDCGPFAQGVDWPRKA